ncbi:MAG: C25 family cysteine peptidase, partial [Planctomycetota bacterium]
MRAFRTLNPEGVSDAFDAEIHGEEPLVAVEETKDQLVISYAFPGFYISDQQEEVDGREVAFQHLNISATGFLSESGKPLLPCFGRYVQIPSDCDFSVTSDGVGPVVFDEILVAPAQEEVTDGPDDNHALEYDADAYTRDGVYPEETVSVTGPFVIDDYRALLVHVCPFQYNPAKKQLAGFGRVNVTIRLHERQGDQPDYQISHDPTLNRESYGNLFLNPARSVESRVAIPSGPFVLEPIKDRGPEFLIIYAKSLKQAAEKLAKWKTRRGLRAETVSIDKIGNDVDKIKRYIRGRRTRLFSRLRYVLFLGDVDTIESEVVHGNRSDYYYSTPEDPTNSDYVLPWLATGRMPVRTLKQAMKVVDQNIAYERNPPTDPSYYDRMTFAAYFQDRNHDGQADAYRYYVKTMQAVTDHMITQGFDVERVYVTESPNPQFYADGTPVPADVRNAFVDETTATDMLVDAASEGQLLIGHRDHGEEQGWSHPSFKNHHLGQIQGNTPTPFYSLNCSTGTFDLVPHTEECFAEKILKLGATAPSLIAPTRVSNTFLNNDMMKALFDAMWGGMLPSFPGSTASYAVRHNRFGDILAYAK